MAGEQHVKVATKSRRQLDRERASEVGHGRVRVPDTQPLTAKGLEDALMREVPLRASEENRYVVTNEER